VEESDKSLIDLIADYTGNDIFIDSEEEVK